MKKEILQILVCPVTKKPLLLEILEENSGHVVRGELVSSGNGARYQIVGGVPRFVASDNYADNFGMQWNQFRKTQLDSNSGVSISGDRFWAVTGWTPNELNGALVLDAGCGAGRFAEIALQAGAQVVAVDYSSAVDACYQNLSQYDNLNVIQADIYALPFRESTFPYVYSLGVLQHTPNVAAAFKKLAEVVSSDGSLCTDYYWKRFRTMLHSKYLVRPITKRVRNDVLFDYLKVCVPTMLRFSQTLGKIPFVGRLLQRMVPVADYTGRFPLSDEQLQEWALLDTFDMLAPEYDNPQTASTIERWYREAGMKEVEIGHWSHLGARGKKQAEAPQWKREEHSYGKHPKL